MKHDEARAYEHDKTARRTRTPRRPRGCEWDEGEAFKELFTPRKLMERKACQEEIRDVSPARRLRPGEAVDSQSSTGRGGSRLRPGEAVDSQSSTGSASMTEAVLAKLESISLNMATREDMGKLNERRYSL